MSTKSVINRLPLDELKGRAGKDKNSTHTHHTFPSNLISPLNEKFASFHAIKGRLLSPFSLFDRVITLPAKQEKHLIDGGRREKKRNSKFENSGGGTHLSSSFPFPPLTQSFRSGISSSSSPCVIRKESAIGAFRYEKGKQFPNSLLACVHLCHSFSICVPCLALSSSHHTCQTGVKVWLRHILNGKRTLFLSSHKQHR